MFKVGIIAVAEGIDDKTIERFVSSIEKSNPSVSYTVKICKGNKSDKFYKTRHLNSALKELIPICEVIIQTDIDLIIPPGLIDEAYKRVKREPNNCYHHTLRYVEGESIQGLEYSDYPFADWLKLKWIYNSGCFNAMTSHTWKRSGGYHPDMCDWGNEDTWFMNKCKKKVIKYTCNSDFPLVHINHPPRTRKNVKHNKKIVKDSDYERDWL